MSFKVNRLFELGTNENTMYKTELLKTHNKDYQFIMHSMTDERCEDSPKVLHMFRINPVDV